MSVQIKFATRKVVQLQVRDDSCCTERYQLLVAKTPGASKHAFLIVRKRRFVNLCVCVSLFSVLNALFKSICPTIATSSARTTLEAMSFPFRINGVLIGYWAPGVLQKTTSATPRFPNPPTYTSNYIPYHLSGNHGKLTHNGQGLRSLQLLVYMSAAECDNVYPTGEPKMPYVSHVAKNPRTLACPRSWHGGALLFGLFVCVGKVLRYTVSTSQHAQVKESFPTYLDALEAQQIDAFIAVKFFIILSVYCVKIVFLCNFFCGLNQLKLNSEALLYSPSFLQSQFFLFFLVSVASRWFLQKNLADSRLLQPSFTVRVFSL